MGFLSRKKPKPAPVEIQEERQIVDELQQMEEAVPERARDEDAMPAGPVAAGDPPSPATAQGMVPPTTSPAAEGSQTDDEGPVVASLEEDEGAVAEEEQALDAAVEEEIDGGDAR